MIRGAALAALTLISVAVHYSALNGWWLSDDPQVLVQALRYTPRDYFTVPEAWRYLSASNFTPLVTLSFEGDLAAAGLDPRSFYLHQLIALTVATWLLFIVLTRYAGPAAAFVGGAMFLVSPQAIVAARSLMVRHYVEGLALALIALLLWRVSRERSRAGAAIAISVIAAIFYLASMLAKEVYAPLPLLMILESVLARERWRRLALRLFPVVLSAVVYVVWRLAMLGSVGGYESTVRISRRFLRQVWTTAFGQTPLLITIILFGVVLLLAAFAAVRKPIASIAVIAVFCVAGLAVLVPIASQLELRHGFAVLVLISAGVALSITASPWKGPAWVLGLSAVLLSAVAGDSVRRLHEEAARNAAVEGQFVWEGPAGGPVLLGESPGWFLGGLSELRRRTGGGEPPRYVLSDEGLATEPIALDTVRVVINGGLAPLPLETSASIDAQRRLFAPVVPAAVTLARSGNVLRWQVGPQPASRLVFLTYPDYDEYVIPPSGTRVIPQPAEKQWFRIRRDLVDGRWNITPPLPLPESGAVTRWQSSE